MATPEQKSGTILLFNVILTFEEAEQEIFDIEIPAGIPENEFVSRLLMSVGANLPELVKISTCMTNAHKAGSSAAIGISEQELPVYLANRSGKYYFTDEDEDTRRWRAFRDGFVGAIRQIFRRRQQRGPRDTTGGSSAASTIAQVPANTPISDTRKK